MHTDVEIARLERALKARNVSVARLCLRAEINQSTWMRWKRGITKQPRGQTWERIVEAASSLGVQMDAS